MLHRLRPTLGRVRDQGGRACLISGPVRWTGELVVDWSTAARPCTYRVPAKSSSGFLAEIEMETARRRGVLRARSESAADLGTVEQWLSAIGDVTTSEPLVVQRHARRCSAAVRRWQR